MGEIGALLDIVQRRNYIGGLKQVIQHVQQTGQPMPFHFSVSHEYFGVYKNNTSRLGILKHPLPQKIATFYTQCFSILEQVKDSTVLPTAQASLMDLQELVACLRAQRNLGRRFSNLTHDLLLQARLRYPPPHPDHRRPSHPHRVTALCMTRLFERKAVEA